MFKKLQQIYSSIIPFDPKKSESYQWFQSDTGEIFGIGCNELTDKDMQILTAFLRKYEPKIPSRTVTEQLWHDLLQDENKQPAEHAFRFIYFTMQKNQTEPAAFRDAIHTLFERTIPILWENETEGILVQDIVPTEEDIQFEQFIHILMADLSADLRFYIGRIHDEVHHVREIYDDFLATGKQIFHLTTKKVIHEIETIPYLLIQQLTAQTKEKLAQQMLQHFHDDTEMLATLEAFFAADLNISETSKNMYMHRNSLQYRLDKFSKETGVNPQNFHEAVTVKLALLARKGLD